MSEIYNTWLFATCLKLRANLQVCEHYISYISSYVIIFSWQPQISVKVRGPPGPLTTAQSKLFSETKNSLQGTLNPKQLFTEICKK